MISSALHFVQINRNHCNDHTNKIPIPEKKWTGPIWIVLQHTRSHIHNIFLSSCFNIYIEITTVKITIIKHGKIPDSMMLKYGQGYVISRYQAKIKKRHTHKAWINGMGWKQPNKMNFIWIRRRMKSVTEPHVRWSSISVRVDEFHKKGLLLLRVCRKAQRARERERDCMQAFHFTTMAGWYLPYGSAINFIIF